MGGEVTMICMDTSKWMLYPENSRWFSEQSNAIMLFCRRKVEADPDNLVGIIRMGERDNSVSLYPTDDLYEIRRVLGAIQPHWQYTDLVLSLLLSELGWLHMKDVTKRIVVFAGGPLDYIDEDMENVAKLISERGVPVDVVDFGTPVPGDEEYKSQNLKAFVNALNKHNENQLGRYYLFPEDAGSISDQLLHSPVLPPIAEGGTSRKKESRPPRKWVDIVDVDECL